MECLDVGLTRRLQLIPNRKCFSQRSRFESIEANNAAESNHRQTEETHPSFNIRHHQGGITTDKRKKKCFQILHSQKGGQQDIKCIKVRTGSWSPSQAAAQHVPGRGLELQEPSLPRPLPAKLPMGPTSSSPHILRHLSCLTKIKTKAPTSRSDHFS